MRGRTCADECQVFVLLTRPASPLLCYEENLKASLKAIKQLRLGGSDYSNRRKGTKSVWKQKFLTNGRTLSFGNNAIWSLVMLMCEQKFKVFGFGRICWRLLAKLIFGWGYCQWQIAPTKLPRVFQPQNKPIDRRKSLKYRKPLKLLTAGLFFFPSIHAALLLRSIDRGDCIEGLPGRAAPTSQGRWSVPKMLSFVKKKKEKKVCAKRDRKFCSREGSWRASAQTWAISRGSFLLALISTGRLASLKIVSSGKGRIRR